MKRLIFALVAALTLVAAVALANDQYHVYKTGSGSCEVDTRDHEAMKSARGSDVKCLAHYDYSTDAHNKLDELKKNGTCN